MLRNRWTVVFLSVFVLGFALLGFVERTDAQVLFGSVSGTITDPSGAGMPKAHVTLINKATSVQKEADTDESGHYTITDVPPGNYDLKVTASGFKPLTQTNLTVTANTVMNGDAKLQVGAISEQVTVEASTVTLQTEKTDVHTELTSKAILDMPLNQYRNYQTLINLVPGATPGVFQNAIADTPERALSTNINGTNRNNNNTRVDGATDVFVWLPHHTVYVPPAETIQEVNISTNNFDPEQGMTGGAAITVITRSGTNQFHGVLFEYHEDQALRARQFFETAASSPRKGKSILNDLGGTFGGPVKKDKLFFFGSYDGTFERDNRQVSTGPLPGIKTVPTAALRVGDFSGTSTKIYDPATGGGNPATRTQFVASSNPSSPAFNSACTNALGCPNMIPAARLSAISQQILALVPPPNLPGDTANYFKSATQRLTRNNFDGKVDWNRTSSHIIFVKYSAMKSVFHGEPNLGKAIGDCACDGGLGDFHSLVQLVTVGHTLTLSPTLVVDGNVGFTRMSEYGKTPDFGTNIGSDVLGIPGTNGPYLRSSGFPLFAISGYANIGNPEGWNPAFRNDWSFTSNHNVRWSHGKHQVSAGTDIVHHHLNHWQPELGAGPRGEFDFGGGATALSGGAAPDRFNALAEFELGLFGELNSQAGANIGAGRSDQFIKATAREWQFGWFVGDRYRVTNKLTLNLGLRYEYYPLMTRNGAFQFDRYDFTTNQVLLGGIGGNPEHLGVTTSKKLFAPRVGVAYRLNEDTVIRSGFGITVDPLPLARPLRGFYPLTVGAAFAGPDGFTPYGSLSTGIPIICCSNIDISSGQFLASVGYVGTQTVHQFGDLNVNASLPGMGQAGQPLNVLFGRTTETDLWQGFLSANYHSLQVSVNRQFTNGLMVKGAYTYSRAIDFTDDDGWAALVWNDPNVIRRNRAPAGFNTPHIFQLAYVYELPVGKGKRWAGSGGVTTKILSDWQVSGIFAAIHGQPFSLTASAASLNAAFQRQTPDQVGPVQKLGGVGTGHPFYDPTAFAPVSASAVYGNVGRNTLYGPGSVNMDFSLFRTFNLTERFNLQFRTDAANLFNAPHFNNPTGSRSSGNFLVITSAKNDERQFRFGLRLAF